MKVNVNKTVKRQVLSLLTYVIEATAGTEGVLSGMRALIGKRHKRIKKMCALIN